MFLLHLQSMDIPRAPTRGISARIPHTTLYIIQLDYDNIKDESLIDRLAYLQEYYKLGDFIVLETNPYARHAYCIDILHLRKALKVIYNSNCDQVFQRGIRINEMRTWILRTHKKGNRPPPKYLYTIESPFNGQRIQSQAHALFLQNYFGAKVRLVNPDGNTKVEMQDYKTSSRTDVKDVEKKETS
jgi:hypothetical protein